MNLEEEVICGFKVTSFRKKIWKYELEMVKLFHNICVENNLRYFAEGGTLLGAIRHNGFIPWDDDIDLIMPREDYEKFLEIAPKYLMDTDFFLQTNKTEKLYFNGHAQIRNSKTTCLIKSNYNDLKLDKNCGVWIDIFPLDYVDGKAQEKKISFLRKISILKVTKEYGVGIKAFIKKIIVFLLCPTNKSCERKIEKINKIAKSAKSKENVGLVSFMPGYEHNIWPTNWFDEATTHKFEDIDIMIPVKYDDVLKREFGNYMEIPENKNGSMHGTCYFDLDKTYKEYENITKEEFINLFKSINY